MKIVKLIDLPIDWKRGSGLRKTDLDINGKFNCVLYGELYTKHKNLLIVKDQLSSTDKAGSVESKAGDILIPGTSTASKKDMLLAREIDINGVYIGGDINIIRPRREIFAKKYIPYYFETIDAYKQLESYITGATGIIHISNTGLKNLAIPLPPLPEQQRIVSILDEAFEAIAKTKANAEQNLHNAKELFESYLQGVFEKKGDGWEEKTLGQLCLFTQGIQRDVKLQSETQGKNQVRFLRIVDYTQGNEPPRYVDFPADKYILNTDDVALVRYGASTGFVCRGLEGALANNLFRVIPKSSEKLTNDFLFIYLQSPIFQKVIKATMNGAAMPAISFGLIKEIPFPLPPLQEQQTIVRQLDALRAETVRLEAVYQQKIADLEELKKSILQKAFA